MRLDIDKGCDKKKKTRNLVKDLEINEVSSVGRGANEGALVSLMKTADHVDQKESENMEELQKELDEQKAKNEELAAKLAKSEFLASLTDLQKAHYSELDEEGQAAFEKASEEDRETLVKEAIEKAEAAEEKIEVDGKEIRKSVVGEEYFELMKAAEAEKAALRETIAKKEAEELQKKAEDEAEKALPHLGGTPTAKAKLWKMAQEDEELLAVVKGCDSHAESLTKENGTSSAAHAEDLDMSASDTLEKMVSLKVKEGLSKAEAWKAVLETKEGKDLYSK